MATEHVVRERESHRHPARRLRAGAVGGDHENALRIPSDVVSWPSSKTPARSIKALQLVEASKAGLKTPHTLISNRPERAAAIVDTFGETECAIKALHTTGVSDEQGLARGECQHEPFTLPASIEASIHHLMDSFGINFASLDMILTPEGEFVFLELNPNGQWLWLEFELGYPLVASLADLLTTNLSST
ncbi:MAG: hypothetical protein E6I91_03500 [Chloroflexi bacterium]|nr:MAG: hypothetical protein E6I91_03500 [Chloroflexota bacterium]